MGGDVCRALVRWSHREGDTAAGAPPAPAKQRRRRRC
eukprot:gene241-6438_t